MHNLQSSFCKVLLQYLIPFCNVYLFTTCYIAFFVYSRQNAEANVPNADIIQEQEVIAVSHTVTENFPERLNRRVPDIKSNKDLSIAVYQTNYLPGLTNGQPKLLSNSQIDMGEQSPDCEKLDRSMSLKLVKTNGFSSPDTLSPDRHLDFNRHRRYVFVHLNYFLNYFKEGIYRTYLDGLPLILLSV